MTVDATEHGGRATRDDIVRLLADITRLGLRVAVEAGRLVVRGPRSTAPAPVHALLTRKNDVLTALLRPDADEHGTWHERAAIAQFDGGLSRADAETLAWAELQAQRLDSQAAMPPNVERPGDSAAMSGAGPGT